MKTSKLIAVLCLFAGLNLNTIRPETKDINQDKIEITRIYTDEKGDSHFDTTYIKLKDHGQIGKVSDLIPGSGVKFRTTPADYDFGSHNAPDKQFVVNLDAPVEIQTTDGETRVIKQGEVFLVEDTTGKGHSSKSINNQMRTSLFIPIN